MSRKSFLGPKSPKAGSESPPSDSLLPRLCLIPVAADPLFKCQNQWGRPVPPAVSFSALYGKLSIVLSINETTLTWSWLLPKPPLDSGNPIFLQFIAFLLKLAKGSFCGLWPEIPKQFHLLWKNEFGIEKQYTDYWYNGMASLWSHWPRVSIACSWKHCAHKIIPWNVFICFYEHEQKKSWPTFPLRKWTSLSVNKCRYLIIPGTWVQRPWGGNGNA